MDLSLLSQACLGNTILNAVNYHQQIKTFANGYSADHYYSELLLPSEIQSTFRTTDFQASRFAPRILTLEYKGDPSSDDTVALVGKGVTFDTGGLNLKPTKHIEGSFLM